MMIEGLLPAAYLSLLQSQAALQNRFQAEKNEESVRALRTEIRRLEEAKDSIRETAARSYVIARDSFQALGCVDGVLIEPVLPRDFDQMANEERPSSQRKWWGRGFIELLATNAGWEFDVRRLDGGAWDRPTWKGRFNHLQEAVERASGLYGYSHWPGL